MIALPAHGLQQRMFCAIPSLEGNELMLGQVIGKSKDEELPVAESLDEREADLALTWEHPSQRVKTALS